MQAPQYLIYLHGFNSSSQSVKALQMAEFVQRYCPKINLITPELVVTPQDALDQVIAIVDDILLSTPHANIHFVGSSMGGFLATLCAQRYGRQAVLINPAVAPHRLITQLIGEHVNPYSGETHLVTLKHGDELKRMAMDTLLQPKSFWVLLQEGDETLDFRDALAFYSGARITLEPLGDHSFEGFNRFLHAIVEFLFEK